jgi:AmmeMemoRadiSam system protein B
VRSPLRKAAHAGTTYEADPDSLRKQFDEFFESDGGPGKVELGSASGRLTGLIAPHIDVRRGGVCYATAYRELASHSDAQTFIILGISHNQTKRRFVLTKKDFQTPLGTVHTDTEMADSLAAKTDRDFFIDEYVHRGEHSIEFQVLFLQYLFGSERDFRILPILCTSFHRLHDSGGREDVVQFQQEVDEFLTSLSETIREADRKVCLIAGVDLSHLGRRFGQDIEITPDFLKMADREDRRMLEHVLAQDSETFLESIEKEKDRRNVCGVPAIYSLLTLLEPGSSKLLKYDWAAETQTQSLVTFAAAAFYRD